MMKKGKLGKLWALICSALACVMVFSLAACSDTKDELLTLDQVTAIVEVGKTTQIKVTSATTKTIEWSVDDSSVATVEGSGQGNKLCTITAKKVGAAVVTAKAGDQTTYCGVSVVPAGLTSGDETVIITLGGELVGTDAYEVKVGADLTFTAVASKGSAITWESSAPAVATVSSTGKVTGVAAGEATITAKVSDSVKATVKVNVVAGPTNVTFAGETEFATGWRYWTGDGEATVTSCVNYPDTNETTINYDFVGGKSYSVQLFYKDFKSSYVEHDVSFTLVSDVADNITINGQEKNLVVGDNAITVEGYAGPTLSIQFGVWEWDIVDGVHEFTVKDLVVTAHADVELKVPSFTITDGVINITDTHNTPADVQQYEIGVFNNATDEVPAYDPIVVTDGATLNMPKVPTGNYLVKVRAYNSSAKVLSSDWSTSVNIAWTNAGTPVEWKANENIAAGSSTWYYWCQNWEPVCSCTSCTIENDPDQGDTIKIVGIQNNVGKTWSFQLFYKGVAGKKLTMKVTSSVDGSITVNGTLYQLKAGVAQDVTVNDVTGLAIVFGNNTKGDENYVDENIKNGDVTFSNIVIA